MFRIESCSFPAEKTNYVDKMWDLKKEFYDLSVQSKNFFQNLVPFEWISLLLALQLASDFTI